MVRIFFGLHLYLAERFSENLQSAKGPAQCKYGPGNNMVSRHNHLSEVESRTQGSRPRPRTQKNPRLTPRTAFPRTDPLEAKDRNARSQGPRTEPQVFSEKEGLQNSFSGDLQFIGVPRIFDWRRPKPQITCYEVIRNFQKRKFLWDKDIVGWKI